MLKQPYNMGDFGVVITLNMKWTTKKIVITIKGNFHTNSAHLQKTQLWRSFLPCIKDTGKAATPGSGGWTHDSVAEV